MPPTSRLEPNVPAALLFGSIAVVATGLLADGTWAILTRQHTLADEWASLIALPIAMGAALAAATSFGWRLPRILARYGALATVTAFGVLATAIVATPARTSSQTWVRTAATAASWLLVAWLAWQRARQAAANDQHGA